MVLHPYVPEEFLKHLLHEKFTAAFQYPSIIVRKSGQHCLYSDKVNPYPADVEKMVT